MHLRKQFAPPHCAYDDCPSRHARHFRYHRRGFYRRALDDRRVQRYRCCQCDRFFSSQSFRFDYRLRLPVLHLRLFEQFVSKVTHRQSARLLHCSRKTVAHRLLMLGAFAREFHRARLRDAGLGSEGGNWLKGTFQLDELETFEHNRRLAPLSVPVLIERRSYFVVDARVATLPCRGGLSPADREKKQERARVRGRRRSTSRKEVLACFEELATWCGPQAEIAIETDRKSSYRTTLAEAFGKRAQHRRYSSTAERGYENPLFPINHTFAMLRDGVSRLVRRTWAASKRAERLFAHMWIWIVYRNYVRGVTNHATDTTPAMALRVFGRKLEPARVFYWRSPGAQPV